MGRNNQTRRAAKAKERQARARSGSRPPGRGTAPAPGVHPGAAQARAGQSEAGWFAEAVAAQYAAPTRSLEQQIADLLWQALQGIAQDRPRLVRDAVQRITQLAVPGSSATSLLADGLVAQVRSAFERGWQPADVHRAAARQLENLGVDLVRDAMVAHLATFAASTVHPRWHAQLMDIDAQPWWDPSSSYLDARLRQPGASPVAVVAGCVRAVEWLTRTPDLHCLDPLPGQYRQSAGNDGREPADQRILTRVRHMLAKAESTTFEAEAETFTAAAQALMARHSIDAAMLAAHDDGCRDGTQAVRIGVDRPYEKPKAILLAAVADANRCQAVWSQHLGFTTVVGFPADVQATETLFTSLLLQSSRAMTAQGSRTTAYGSRTRSFRSAFLTSYAHRIGERLAEVAREQTDEAAAQIAGAGAGRDLVRVLADRSAEVQAATTQLFPQLSQVASSRSLDAEGWHAGRRAADQADFGVGPAVTTRSTS